jgi:ACS family tartrate transporter-like MFS transporter
VTDLSELEARTTKKVFWRLIPLCFVLYVISYIDRTSISYAALQMTEDMGLTPKVFGFATGVFFLGYFLFEVPSNVALIRFGSRAWLTVLLLTWGTVNVLTGFVTRTWQLHSLRFLLGMTEAGFFPGLIIYVTYWFRAKGQATTIALLVAAIPVSSLIGAPLSTFIMEQMDHLGGWRGWRWMFVTEGLPAVLGGFACWLLLTDRPSKAKWLTAEERDWLEGEIAGERAGQGQVKSLNTLKSLTDPGVLYLSVVFFIYQCGSFGVTYWMPQLIKGLAGTLTTQQIGLVSMIPYAVATLAMVLWSKSSDRAGERKLHAAWPLLLSAIALGAAPIGNNAMLGIGFISLAMAGLYAFRGPFWSMPSLFLTRTSAAISIAAINSVGNLGGFVGPYAIGAIKDRTGNAMVALYLLSALLFVSFLMIFFAKLPGRVAAEGSAA